MSDVSGIPNMGFGGGNFFAPQFSYNPQMSAGQASAAYMPAENYAQNVTNNLFSSGGGFGRQTDYYSQQVANSYGNINAGTGLQPVGTFSDYNAGGAWPTSGGGGGASPYQTTPNVFDTGASPFWGGGGSSGMGGSIYGGGLGGFSGGSYGGYGGDSFGGFGGSTQNPYPNMSMPGGLGSPMSNSQTQALDWGGLFSGGGARTSGIAPDTTGGRGFDGGAHADPSPGMAMPGGLGSPMSTPQQPGINWDSVGAAAGAGSNMPSSKDLLGYTPDVFPTKADKSQDQPVFDFSGSVGGTNAPTMPSSEKLLGYDPNKGPTEFDWSNFQSPANRYDQFQAPGGGGGDTDLSSSNKSAATIAEEARARLADIIGSPETAKAVEDAKATPDAAAIPLPRERPEGADVQRPPADVPPQDLVPLAGRNLKYELAGVNKTFAKALQEFTREYNVSQGDYSMALRSGKGDRDKGFHASGNAVDVNLIDRRTGERLTDYQTRDPNVFKAYQDNANAFHTFLEKNYPELAAQHRWGGYFSGGVNTYGAQDIMHHDLGGRVGMAGGSWAGGLGQQAADTWELPYGGGTKTPLPQFNFDWSNAPIPDVGPMPLTYKSPGGGSVYQIDPTTGQRYSPPMGGKDKMGELPGRDFVPAAPVSEQPSRSPSTGLAPGETAPRPPADIPNVSNEFPNGVPMPMARPAAANIAQANSVLDSRIIDLVQKNSPSDAGRIPSSIANQTLREALGNTMTGGAIRSGLTPYLPQMGVSQAEFDKAYNSGASGAAPVSRFFGNDEEIANRQVMPGELTSKWNELIYEGVNKPTMARSESLGADPNPFKDFRQAEIDDRRNDPALTDEQRQTLSKLVPRGSYLPEPGAKIPEGGKLGEALGTQQLGNLEANATMRGTTQGARLPRAVGDPFEGDVSDGGFNFLDAAADGTSTQQGPTMPPWQTAIPQDKRDPGTIAAIEEGARRTGLAPEAIAAVITEESNWDPRNATGQFRGLTQMQEQTFKEAPGGRINGLNWDQYKNASGADQVKAYIDWLYQHNSLDRAANLGIDIRGKDPAEQAAWLQAFQFSPYGGLPEVKIPWVQEAFKGNYGMPVTNQPQAKDLGDWTLNAMRHRFGEEMMKNWPDTGRLPGGQ